MSVPFWWVPFDEFQTNSRNREPFTSEFIWSWPLSQKKKKRKQVLADYTTEEEILPLLGLVTRSSWWMPPPRVITITWFRDVRLRAKRDDEELGEEEEIQASKQECQVNINGLDWANRPKDQPLVGFLDWGLDHRWVWKHEMGRWFL